MSKMQDRAVQQYDMTRRQFRMLPGWFAKLGLIMSVAHNAIYDCTDILEVLVRAASANTFVESAVMCGSTKNKLRKNGLRIPDSDLVMSALRSVGPRHARAWCTKTVARSVRLARRAGLLRNIEAVAIDVTDIPYHGKGLKKYTRKSRPKDGTSTFFSYVAAHGIGFDSQILLDVQLLTAAAGLADFISGTCARIARSGMFRGAPLFLYDRGFYNVRCMAAAGRAGCRYIMPATMNKKIQSLIRQYTVGDISQVTRQTMTNNEGTTIEYNLVIVERDAEDGTQYMAFATNIPIRNARALTYTMLEHYGQRWDIETGFRVVKERMGRTCSNSMTVRLLMFYLPVLTYNLWRIAVFVYVGQKSRRPASRMLTMMMFLVCAIESFVNDRGK